jgi:3-dehydroquinate synthase II
MKPGEGMLVGSQSAGLFLVEAEVHRNPHVEPRPFRVNAGPVSSYVLTPGWKTRYLAELTAGDEILIVDRSGVTRTGHIGRVKIERRPMVVVETEVERRTFSTILQNAETVRLVSDSTSIPVSDLKQGSLVLLRVEEGGRHFGTLVADEMVIER